jgi:hypothetical protein
VVQVIKAPNYLPDDGHLWAKHVKRTVTIVLCIVFVSAGPSVRGITIRWDYIYFLFKGYSLSWKLYKHSEA